ncbi:hypothetical protein ON010_g17488 [Phytophthora cinnamomi]|nr:hypothetical protein ON010_g17488 [Phytophthora cinnamomi]
MLALLQDAHFAATDRYESVRRSRYCASLAAAISPINSSSQIDTVRLALQLRLFNPVHQLATSMHSEDHVAVIPVLQELVLFARGGSFGDVLVPANKFRIEKILAEEALLSAYNSVIKSSKGDIGTKEALPAHLKHYLKYLHSVTGRSRAQRSQLPTLCHAHPGLLPSATPLTVSPPLTDPQCFGGAGGLRSPVYRKLKALFDAIGPAHYGASRGSWNDMLEVINNTVQNNTSMVDMEQLVALHACLLRASRQQAGVLRLVSAVGYEAPGLHRVFLPAGEVFGALHNYLGVINEGPRWQKRPLAPVYYAFAAVSAEGDIDPVRRARRSHFYPTKKVRRKRKCHFPSLQKRETLSILMTLPGTHSDVVITGVSCSLCSIGACATRKLSSGAGAAGGGSPRAGGTDQRRQHRPSGPPRSGSRSSSCAS